MLLLNAELKVNILRRNFRVAELWFPSLHTSVTSHSCSEASSGSSGHSEKSRSSCQWLLPLQIHFLLCLLQPDCLLDPSVFLRSKKKKNTQACHILFYNTVTYYSFCSMVYCETPPSAGQALRTGILSVLGHSHVPSA